MPHEISLDAARAIAGLALARAERMSGTGASATVRLTGILKFAADRSETELLSWLQDRLGADYAALFPRFHELGEADGFFVTELEYVGDATFEDVLTGKTRDGVFEPTLVTDRVAAFLNRLAEVPSEPTAGNAFLGEIVEAAVCNARTAGIPLAADEKSWRKRASFVPTLCHRDLSTGNVMCGRNGDIRLIDPRYSMPGAGVRTPSFGSAAADAAAFLVGLERKELERERAGQHALRLTERFRSSVDAWVAVGRFNAFMLDLCLAHAYSVYAACRCDYCLAPERKWLYDLMRERFEEVSRRIA